MPALNLKEYTEVMMRLIDASDLPSRTIISRLLEKFLKDYEETELKIEELASKLANAADQ